MLAVDFGRVKVTGVTPPCRGCAPKAWAAMAYASPAPAGAVPQLTPPGRPRPTVPKLLWRSLQPASFPKPCPGLIEALQAAHPSSSAAILVCVPTPYTT
jgi:hypothetical protein